MELMVKKSLLIWHTMWIVQSLHSWSYSERLLWGGCACDVSTVGTSSCKWMQFLEVLQQFEHCSNLISTNKVAAVYHKTTFHHNVRVWWACIMLWTTLIWAITKLNDNYLLINKNMREKGCLIFLIPPCPFLPAFLPIPSPFHLPSISPCPYFFPHSSDHQAIFLSSPSIHF